MSEANPSGATGAFSGTPATLATANPSSASMTDADILRILDQTQAVRRGHFKLTSGLHSDTYIQCARLLEHPRLTNRLAAEAVARLPKDLKVDLVASPAVGGILFGFAVAAALDVDFIFSERVEGKMRFRRSFQIPPGARVLVAEDVVTTGGSVREVIDLVAAAGAEGSATDAAGATAGAEATDAAGSAARAKAVAVVSLISRGEEQSFSTDFYPLLRIQTPAWQPEDCELCKQVEPITSPGSRNLAK
jgi:orotate phosphoribosyltransferase